MFNPTYPNLELLEYKAKLVLLEDPEFQKKWNKISPISLDAYVFPQIWGKHLPWIRCHAGRLLCHWRMCHD